MSSSHLIPLGISSTDALKVTLIAPTCVTFAAAPGHPEAVGVFRALEQPADGTASTQRKAHQFMPANGEANGLKISRYEEVSAAGVVVNLKVAAAVLREQISVKQEVRVDLPWTSYVIAPGVMYDGNRFLVSPQPYCPYIATEGVSPEGPILMVDVPRLTANRGYRTELAANALTTPILGVFDPQRGVGALFVVETFGPWGVAGLTVTTLPGEPVSVTLSLPVQRKDRYGFCNRVDANERGMTLKAGDTLQTRLQVIPVTAATIPEFVSKLSREAFARRDQGKRTFALGLAEAAALVEAKQNALNWRDAEGYYATDLNLGSPWSLQTGWVGGGVTMVALLQSTNPESRARARRMLYFLCTVAAPSGYFYGALKDGRWISFGGKRPGCRAFSLARRPLELGRDILKAIEIIQQRGESLNPVWEAAALRWCCLSVSRVWAARLRMRW
jgi:hypothetical protein